MNTKPSRGPFHYSAPSRFFYKVVRGMLPHRTARGRKMMALLHVYDGMPTRFQHIRKVKVVTAYRHLRLDPNRPMTRLGALCSEFGWSHGKLIAKLERKRQIKTKVLCKDECFGYLFFFLLFTFYFFVHHVDCLFFVINLENIQNT